MASRQGGSLVIGVTGGIGTGKSAVLKILASLGAEGIDADLTAHAVMAPDGPVHGAVVAAFGPEIVAADGMIDRKRLGARVFADSAALSQLEAIVHPAVAQAIGRRIAASRATEVAIEAIKLLESGLSRQLCDQVWVTRCSRRQQIARLSASRGMPAEEARRRLAAQMPPAQMASQADRIIDTNGSLAETAMQALAGWVELGLPLPAVTLRAATAADAASTAALLNSVVREGGLTVVNRTFTVAQERAFLRRLPPRARITLAEVGGVVVGFQSLEPYSPVYTTAMDHVGVIGTFVLACLRGRGIGQLMAQATVEHARQMGFTKLVINVRGDNSGAQAFYRSLGFQPCGRLTDQVFIDGRYVDEMLYEMFINA